jgi:hypothetical protein
MKKAAIAMMTTVLAVTLLVGCSSQAPQHETAVPGGKVTIAGEVVDTACWIGHDTKGPDHAQCAEMCAKAGIPLAILDTQGDVLYLPISTDHRNPNEKLIPFIDKKVKVSGTVMEKNGMRGIVIEEIEATG